MKTWQRTESIPGWYNPEKEMRVTIHHSTEPEGGEVWHQIEVVENPELLTEAEQVESIKNHYSKEFNKLYQNIEIITMATI